MYVLIMMDGDVEKMNEAALYLFFILFSYDDDDDDYHSGKNGPKINSLIDLFMFFFH